RVAGRIDDLRARAQASEGAAELHGAALQGACRFDGIGVRIYNRDTTSSFRSVVKSGGACRRVTAFSLRRFLLLLLGGEALGQAGKLGLGCGGRGAGEDRSGRRDGFAVRLAHLLDQLLADDRDGARRVDAELDGVAVDAGDADLDVVGDDDRLVDLA